MDHRESPGDQRPRPGHRQRQNAHQRDAGHHDGDAVTRSIRPESHPGRIQTGRGSLPGRRHPPKESSAGRSLGRSQRKGLPAQTIQPTRPPLLVQHQRLIQHPAWIQHPTNLHHHDTFLKMLKDDFGTLSRDPSVFVDQISSLNSFDLTCYKPCYSIPNSIRIVLSNTFVLDQNKNFETPKFKSLDLF